MLLTMQGTGCSPIACPKLSNSDFQRVQEGRYRLTQGCLSMLTDLAAACCEAAKGPICNHCLQLLHAQSLEDGVWARV